MTTGKNMALTIQIFVSKVMSLLFNTLSRFVIAFLPRNKPLLMSWLTVNICSDFGTPEDKIGHCIHSFPCGGKMAVWKDMYSPTPVRTLKFQLAAEQPSTGGCWSPSKKDILIHRQRRSRSEVVGGGKSP